MTSVCFGQAMQVKTSVGNESTSAQVSCGSTATLLRAAITPATTTPSGRVSITFQNMSAQDVYIAPRSDLTTANAGIILPQYYSFTTDRSSGYVAWYCITSSSTATVGYTEEK
jgi:hypothetical protein